MTARSVRERLATALERSFGIDLRALALFRVSLAALVLTDLAQRSPNLVAHYSDHGVLPRASLLGQFPDRAGFCLHLMGGGFEVQAALFLLATLAALALLVGFRTRAALLVCWILMMSVDNRNPLILNSGDTLLRLLLFWGLFLPLGERLSVDAALAPARERTGLRHLSAGSVALLLQVCFVYWFAAAHKWQPHWQSGEAVRSALELDVMVSRLGLWLRQHEAGLRVLGRCTLGLEALGPLLVLLPLPSAKLRLLVISGFLLLHAGFAAFLAIGLFPYVSMVSWLPFLPSSLFDALARTASGAGGAGHLGSRLGRWLYPALAAIPPAADRSTPMLEPGPPPASGPKWTQMVPALLIVLVLGFNLRSLDHRRYQRFFPPGADRLGRVLRLDQSWKMFANPTETDGWFVVPGQLRSGATVDLVDGGGPVSWAKPASVSATFADRNWRSYMMKLPSAANTRLRVDYARYLCRSWNRGHALEQQLSWLQLCFMREATARSAAPPVKEVLLIFDCERDSVAGGEDMP